MKTLRKMICALLFGFAVFQFHACNDQVKYLPRSTPQAEKVDAEAIYPTIWKP
jgi:hypothetical protein